MEILHFEGISVVDNFDLCAAFALMVRACIFLPVNPKEVFSVGVADRVV